MPAPRRSARVVSRLAPVSKPEPVHLVCRRGELVRPLESSKKRKLEDLKDYAFGPGKRLPHTADDIKVLKRTKVKGKGALEPVTCPHCGSQNYHGGGAKGHRECDCKAGGGKVLYYCPGYTVV